MRLHARLRNLSVFSASIAISIPMYAQPAMIPDSAIQSAITARVESGFSKGIVVGLLRPDGSRHYFSAGTSGRAGLQLDSQTVFEIGSITKAFTGTLLAQMVEAGDVKFDDPVATLLPDSVAVPERAGKQITLVDLATQSSGLPRLPTNLSPADPLNPYASYSVADLYQFLSGLTLTRDIGQRYEYSNLGVGLLGHALARKAGASYEQAVVGRLLEPAGLDDTRITLTPAMRQRLAIGHRDGAPVPNWDLPTLAGAGALRSTAQDMLDFIAANVDTRNALADVYRLAREPRRDVGTGMRIGLGWHVRAAGDRAIVWHNGGIGGYHAFTGFDPATGLGVVVLSNSTSDIDDIGMHILDPSVPIVASRSVKPVDVPAEVLERYTGVYELAPTFSITVTHDEGTLIFQGTRQPPFRSVAASETEFLVPAVDARITFDVGADGTVSRLTLHQGGNSTPGRKVR